MTDYELDLEEKELLKKISANDENAFEIIFNRYQKKIYSFCFYLTRSDFQAEEITQEVFENIWRYRQNLADVEHFNGYLKRIAKNILSKQMTRLGHERLILNSWSETIDPWTESSESVIDSKEIQKILLAAIRNLSPQQRKVYSLSRRENLTYDQIAIQLDISSHTVKEHMQKALHSIRHFLKLHGDISSLLVFFILQNK